MVNPNEQQWQNQSNYYQTSTAQVPPQANPNTTPAKKSSKKTAIILVIIGALLLALVAIVIVAILLIAAVFLFLRPTSGSEVSRPSIVIENRNWSDVQQDLIHNGIAYTVDYVNDPSLPVDMIISYTQNVAGTEYAFTVVSSITTVPDFFTAGSEEELRQMADDADLKLELMYMDDDGNLYDVQPDSTFMGIYTVSNSAGATTKRGSTISVTVLVYTEPELNITGHWHFCDYDSYSLELGQLSFYDDGTFYFYGMSYLPVYVPTDLYLYDQYWSGARGSTEFSGTYTVQDDQVTLHFGYYDYSSGQYVSGDGIYYCYQEGDSLRFSWSGGGYYYWDLDRSYAMGLTPEGTNQEAITSATGTWYFFEEPENIYDDTYHCSFTQLTVYSDGTCDASNPTMERGPYSWSVFYEEYPEYKGTCSFDGTIFEIHYTSLLVIDWWNGTYEYVPCDIYIRLTVEMDNAVGIVTDSGDLNVVRIGRLSPQPDLSIWTSFDYDTGMLIDNYLYN